jgi:hypothetical protein
MSMYKSFMGKMTKDKQFIMYGPKLIFFVNVYLSLFSLPMLESIHILIKFAQNFFDQFVYDYVSTIKIYQGILYFLKFKSR